MMSDTKQLMITEAEQPIHIAQALPPAILANPSVQANAQATITEEEAADLLVDALASSEPYPINLDWLVPLLHYKHISSLTTHLKRHFQKDVDYKKCSVGGGVRAYTYQITVRCFKKICTKARHASRKQVALYWIKMIDKKVNHGAAGDCDGGFKDGLKRKLQKKGPAVTSHAQYDDEDDDLLDVEEDDEEDVDYSPYRSKGVTSNVILNNLTTLSNSNSFHNNSIQHSHHHAEVNNHHHQHRQSENDSDLELDHSSSVFLRSLRQPPPIKVESIPAAPSPSTSSTASTLQTLSSPLAALTMYSASAVPHTTRRKDFSNVSILNRKRKSNPEEQWPQMVPQKKVSSVDYTQKRAEEVRAKERVNSNTRTNLRMLSQLALGLR